jgi:hypothetical protein
MENRRESGGLFDPFSRPAIVGSGPVSRVVADARIIWRLGSQG